jgi:hypothetical protein
MQRNTAGNSFPILFFDTKKNIFLFYIFAFFALSNTVKGVKCILSGSIVDQDPQ